MEKSVVVYTDGSVMDPKWQEFAMGGAAAWTRKEDEAKAT